MTSIGGTRVLVVWESGALTQVVRPGESIVLGRRADADLRIPLRSISRRHARFVCLGDVCRVEDLDSRNGVRVGGRALHRGEPQTVALGDIVDLGGAVVVLHAAPDDDAPGDAPHPGAIARATARNGKKDLGTSQELDRLLDVVAQSDLGVLLLGEPGVGKSSIADAIHGRSLRACAPCVRIDGRHANLSLVREAAGGTLVLDEVGELSVRDQLAVEDAVAEMDVRLVGTSHRDMYRECCAGRVRPELYRRLSGVRIVIPPLRERAGEIAKLAARFLLEAAAREGRLPPRLSNEALGVLVHHPFYGNIAELKRTMERACVLAGSGYVGPEHLAFDGSRAAASVAPTLRRFVPTSATEPPGPSSDTPPPITIPEPPRAPKIEEPATRRPRARSKKP